MFYIIDWLFLGYVLDCFFCISEVFWEDCEKNIRNGICVFYFDNCVKLYVRGNGEVFVWGCEIFDECFNNLMCKGLELNECSFYCCKEDFCNRSVVKKMNYFILVLFLVISIIIKYCY